MCSKHKVTALIKYRFPRSDPESLYIDSHGVLLHPTQFGFYPNIANPQFAYPLAPDGLNPRKRSTKNKSSALPMPVIQVSPPIPTQQPGVITVQLIPPDSMFSVASSDQNKVQFDDQLSQGNVQFDDQLSQGNVQFDDQLSQGNVQSDV
ncbi:hypothetical protein TVAGG3_1029790 [Trichomonas vaginalis G3]|uniref:hypothetical protein n=1 Tax=Trichomonas vaginalis (strain ATCC PRA-98 / G3) TaxID=412133 RepID=UPI0021E60FA8|nr:hypothetical protein TVAGG3_1029790 [Trichomonas vaginalis G3]KAI5492769.1 hypothetical protein TVAGG3_1029790 [Trichomonas vaginalis G3]